MLLRCKCLNYNLLGKASAVLMVASAYFGEIVSGTVFFVGLVFSLYKLQGGENVGKEAVNAWLKRAKIEAEKHPEKVKQVGR